MTEAITVTRKELEAWANGPAGPVALHLRQKLLPVEGEDGVIFPPTYADIGYNVDTLSDGTKVATIDSVGSQANRIEPLFTAEPLAKLVPQIRIRLPSGEETSLMSLAHRAADATILGCPDLVKLAAEAFASLKKGDAGPLAWFSPTSLIFGVWDSRGGSGQKVPRLLRAVIRAYGVEVLHSAAQYTAAIRHASDADKQEFAKSLGVKADSLSDDGFADAPAIFRPVSSRAAKEMPEFANGLPNLDRRALGGVIARGGIRREVTLNLIALRRLHTPDAEKGPQLRQYILALSLLAALADGDDLWSLREGCLLRSGSEPEWRLVPRYGDPQRILLVNEKTKQLISDFAGEMAEKCRDNWPSRLDHAFEVASARAELEKRNKKKAKQKNASEDRAGSDEAE